MMVKWQDTLETGVIVRHSHEAGHTVSMSWGLLRVDIACCRVAKDGATYEVGNTFVAEDFGRTSVCLLVVAHSEYTTVEADHAADGMAHP